MQISPELLSHMIRWQVQKFNKGALIISNAPVKTLIHQESTQSRKPKHWIMRDIDKLDHAL